MSSEQPSRRGRLSLSTQPSRVPNSVPTTTSRRTSGGPSTSQQHHNRHGDDDNPLFIPTDTQYQNDHDDDHSAPRLSQAEVEAIAGLGDIDDLLDGMDDLQHEEEVEEMRASQQAASQAPPPPPPPSRRQPLAERQLDDADLLGMDTTLAEAAKQIEDADTTAEGMEGEEEGDVTRQADFEVHGDYGANVPGDVNVPENEMGDITTGPGDTTAGEEGGVDTTGPVDELEEEEEDGLPATQHPGDADSRVSTSSSVGMVANQVVQIVLR